ncbi:MAG: hypothetical protein AAGI01_06835 [Myxococcota bacterium]
MNRYKTRATFALFTATLTACMPASPYQCERTDDCRHDELCRFSRCVLVDLEANDGEDREASYTPAPISQPPPIEALPPDMATDMDTDMPESSPEEPLPDLDMPNPADHATVDEPECAPASPERLVLNELLANVPPGQEGDANRDGERHAFDDEFIELVNVTAQPLNIRGVMVFNGDKLRHTFAERCVPPYGAVVLFGGPKGAPVRSDGQVSWVSSDTRLSLSNTSGLVRVRAESGALLAHWSYEDAPPRSLVATPELSGRGPAPHPKEAGAFSPGTCAGGGALASRCAQ